MDIPHSQMKRKPTVFKFKSHKSEQENHTGRDPAMQTDAPQDYRDWHPDVSEGIPGLKTGQSPDGAVHDTKDLAQAIQEAINCQVSILKPSLKPSRHPEDYFDCIIFAKTAWVNKYLFSKDDVVKQLGLVEGDNGNVPDILTRDIRVGTVYGHSRLFREQVRLWLATGTDEELIAWRNGAKKKMDISDTMYPWAETLDLILMWMDGDQDVVEDMLLRPGDTYVDFFERSTDVLSRAFELGATECRRWFVRRQDEILMARLNVLNEYDKRNGGLREKDGWWMVATWWNGDVWRYEKRPDDWKHLAHPRNVRRAFTPPEPEPGELAIRTRI